jgi:hypothetical protein
LSLPQCYSKKTLSPAVDDQLIHVLTSVRDRDRHDKS